MPSYRRKPIDLVLDVRSRLEFWLGHLDGATCIPVGMLARVVPTRDDVTSNSRILVYCASGVRSAAAVQILKSLGYRNVTNGGALSAARADYSA
ncbi:MAG: rhodanese-like domain-containing protein [Gemmatimonadaceae bacterium]|nr:rhodanese-like domain-containing protein [Gemmatimonadaceae bacterium]